MTTLSEDLLKRLRVKLLVIHVPDFHGLQMLVTWLASSSTKPYPAGFEVLIEVLMKLKSSGA
jgi:hypothetical protein